jgi:Zn-dependent metalloprotease
LRTGFPAKTNAAFYYQGLIRLGDGDGTNYKHIPRDPSIVSHEVAHAIIDRLSGMSSEGESGSINEGFADFLTSSIWENPQLGHTAFMKGPYKRSVESELSLKEKTGGLYHDSAIVSGLFWKIRSALGPIKSQSLALKTIARLGVNPNFTTLRFSILDAAKTLNLDENEIASITEYMDKRAL